MALTASGRQAVKGKRWLDCPGRGAGEWMRDHLAVGPEVPVMADGGEIAFYAGAQYIFFPADETRAILEYARHKKVQFIAVEEKNTRGAFLGEIEADPPPGLQLLHTHRDGNASVRIYRLD